MFGLASSDQQIIKDLIVCLNQACWGSIQTKKLSGLFNGFNGGVKMVDLLDTRSTKCVKLIVN